MLLMVYFFMFLYGHIKMISWMKGVFLNRYCIAQMWQQSERF